MGLGGFFLYFYSIFQKSRVGGFFYFALLAGVDEFLRHKWFFLLLLLRLTNVHTVLYVLMYYLKKKE